MPLSRQHALILLLVGPLSALAALFAPEGRWVGVDPGAVGASVFMLVAATAIALFATRGEGVFPEDMSVVERRASNRWLVHTGIWALLSHLVGRSAGGVEEDERDLRLRHRTDRAGHVAFVLIVVGVCLLASLPRTWLDWWLEPIVLANLLIGLLMAKVFVENLVLTYAYRAGRA